ncbi:hypothetical protein CCR94_13320 [Rhodoblastus sphagnicola]|uniref:Branched-chain amino acid transport n=1 Tax=Rhodoblastus sphagnicola TaxID=333368 RepID=A0A2S6N6R6_9HYPH|nr:AzlD domain-containing protein [Rhodoblastus sphagnicola]MBB4197594.1 hypothetical protein [Rhodoblastus sphagnicola]PPQ30293.1 hypothetical protein CCR94_13320 [Rhodoblastus sphagnicola]
MSFDPALHPYLAVIVLGFLPSEVWRWLSVVIAHKIDEQSELFRLVRCIATALLVGVVLKIVATPPRELAAVPLLARGGAFAFAATAFFAFRRSVFAAIFAGEAAIVFAAWWWG